MFLITSCSCIFVRTKGLYGLWQAVQPPAGCSPFQLHRSAITYFAPWNWFSPSFAVPSAGLSSASISPALQKPAAEKPLLPSKAEEFASTSSTSLELNDMKYCRLCCVPLNNLFSAEQHYIGKKHRRNIARKKIMEELGDEALLAEVRINGKQNVSKWGQLE